MAKKTEEEQVSKENQIRNALLGIEKHFGKGAVMRMGDKPEVIMEVISTGSLEIDGALGIGGFPRGRIIDIAGPNASGKTTLTLHTIAQLQKSGGTAAFIDAEHALDPVYARALGVDTDSLILSQPDNGEQALEIVDKLIDTKVVDLIIIDSVAALVPKAELDGEMGDNQMGLQARLMSKAMRKITGKANTNNVTVIFINQIREKIGVLFGSNETSPGGNALKFYASVRVDIRKSTAIKNGEEIIGNKTKVKIIKNKVAPPFRTAEVDILYGVGIDFISELLDVSVKVGNIKQSGSWFSYGESRLGQGRASVIDILKDNPELCEELKSKIGFKNVEVQE